MCGACGILPSRPRDPAIIGVRAEAQDDGQNVSVPDNGVDFSPTCQDRLCGALQDLCIDREFEGTGVGLSIVRRSGQSTAEGLQNWGEAFSFR